MEQETAAPSAPAMSKPHAEAHPGGHGMASGLTATAERMAEHAGDRLWHDLKRRPYLGVAAASAAGFFAAMTIGVGELAIGIAAGYAAYQVLKNNVPPSQAIRAAVRIEKNILA